jgi:hypothetical protein
MTRRVRPSLMTASAPMPAARDLPLPYAAITKVGSRPRTASTIGNEREVGW